MVNRFSDGSWRCRPSIMVFCILAFLAIWQVYAAPNDKKKESPSILEKMVCEGNVHEFKNYVRLVTDTDLDDLMDQSAKCTFPAVDTQLNAKKRYSLVFGVRMTDFIKHDETDKDYLQINIGPGAVQLTPEAVYVTYEKMKKECLVSIFQNENSKDFSPKHVFHVRIDFQKTSVVVLTAPNNENKWTICSKYTVKSIAPRKVELEAFSRFGMNIDIVSVELDAAVAPWAKATDTAQETEHHVEHTHQADKLYKNVTLKELTKIGTSINRLWYCQIAVFFTIFCMAIKYKSDKNRKMHLL